MPLAPSVSTSSAPKARMRLRRSTDMVSGMTMMMRLPRTAAMAESPMPVLPEVGSMMTVSSSRTPASTAASIIDWAARSFTEPVGLNDSTFDERGGQLVGALVVGQLHQRRMPDQLGDVLVDGHGRSFLVETHRGAGARGILIRSDSPRWYRRRSGHYASPHHRAFNTICGTRSVRTPRAPSALFPG